MALVHIPEHERLFSLLGIDICINTTALLVVKIEDILSGLFVAGAVRSGMTKRLAYLGPRGTYSEQAALAHDPEAELLPFSSIASVAAAVDSGEADEAVVPIENSLEGAVTFTLDVLIHQSHLFIRNEIVVPIRHCLVVKTDADADQIEVIYSHPQSLAQCRGFLEKRFPGIGQVASLSNSAAVEDMQKSTLRGAAIAPERAAEIYGARVVERGVQDDPNNLTRFVVLATSDHP